MLAMRTIKKNRTVRQMLHDADKSLPNEHLGTSLHLMQLFFAQAEEELAQMGLASVSQQKVSWDSAQHSVNSILRDLASISVLAAKAMGSFIDDINAEVQHHE